MEHKEHHKRELLFLIGYLIVFFIISAIALLNLRRGIPVFGIGLPYLIEDGIIITLSIIATIKTIWHIAAY